MWQQYYQLSDWGQLVSNSLDSGRKRQGLPKIVGAASRDVGNGIELTDKWDSRYFYQKIRLD